MPALVIAFQACVVKSEMRAGGTDSDIPAELTLIQFPRVAWVPDWLIVIPVGDRNCRVDELAPSYSR